jgi:SOS-response transcriptional repressor LexA
MTTNVSKVLTQLMKENNLSSAELARLTDVVQPVIYRMASGETDNPKIATLIPLAKHFNLTIDQLIGLAPLSLNKSLATEEPIKSKWFKIPLLSWHDVTSWPNMVKDNLKEYVYTDTEVGSNGFALRVTDNSMHPQFKKNTVLIFSRTASAQSGDFILAGLHDSTEIIFKQLLIDGNDRYLKPLNPEFRTIYIEKNEKFKIFGVLVEAKINFK